MRIIKYCLLAMLWPGATCLCQNPSDKIHPLTIGDTVPDIQLINVLNNPVSKIQLSNLKGRLVILDFWGRYCAPCIQALPKLNSLQKMFEGKVQVITISDFNKRETLINELGRFFKMEEFQLPVLLANDSLSILFRHLLVSHVVWIDQTGKIKAITGTDYVTQNNIKTVLEEKTVNWPVKQDFIGFNYKLPLLALAQPSLASPKFLYYSTFTGYIDGIAPPAGTYTDSGANSTFTCFYNYGLLALCQMALDYRTGAGRNRFVLKVRDTAKYISPVSSYREDWKRENTYCYYLRLPLGISAKAIQSIVQQDILRWLNIMGIRAIKEVHKSHDIEETEYIIMENG